MLSLLKTEGSLGLCVAVLAWLWVTVFALWGFAAHPSTGHFAVNSAIGIAGENMVRGKIGFPSVALGITIDPPPLSTYYTHHPFGIFWTAAFAFRLFGRHSYLLQLIPAVYTSLSALLLYRIGCIAWGPLAGALCIVTFSVLPITLGYAAFFNLEVPLIFSCLLSTWGYLRFSQTWRLRYLGISVLAMAFALQQDWEAYVWAGGLLGYGFLRLLLPERIFGTIHVRRMSLWWALGVAVCVASLLGYLLALARIGHLDELLSTGRFRSAGDQTAWAEIWFTRKNWLNMTFTLPMLLVGAVAFPVVVLRAALFRLEGDIVVLPLFGMALFQYLCFKNGADVHVFWPHPFVPALSLAVGALATTGFEMGGALLRSVGRTVWSPLWIRIVFALHLLLLALVLRMAIPWGKYIRATGGCATEKYLARRLPETDVVLALRWFLKRSQASGVVRFHPSQPIYHHTMWEIGPRPWYTEQGIDTADSPDTTLFLLDASVAPLEEMAQLAARHKIHAINQMWFVDGREPYGPLEGYVFDEREPTWKEWMFQEGGIEPMRSIRPDPWATWELRTALGQPAVPPSSEPVTLEQKRIQSNILYAQGLRQASQRLRQEVAKACDVPVHLRYNEGTELLGGRVVQGSRTRVWLYFVAGASPGRSMFQVHSRVVSPPVLWPAPVDTGTLDVAPPFPLQTGLWKEGFLYSLEMSINRRPGTELFEGSFSSLVGGDVPTLQQGEEPAQILVFP